jgi:hypothetical protein
MNTLVGMNRVLSMEYLHQCYSACLRELDKESRSTETLRHLYLTGHSCREPVEVQHVVEQMYEIVKQ